MRPAVIVDNLSWQDTANPEVTIGTSTPGADPSGDYTLEFFAKVDAVNPGLGKLLSAKARPLVGGPTSPAILAGHAPSAWMISEGKADIFISYASNGWQVSGDPDLTVISIPAELNPTAEYALTLSIAAHCKAALFGKFLLDDAAQLVLTRNGFSSNE